MRGGRAPPQGGARGRGPPVHANGVARAPPPRAPAPLPVPVPKEDFDFEAALAKFEKADIKVCDAYTPHGLGWVPME